MLGHLRRQSKVAASALSAGLPVSCRPVCGGVLRGYHSYPDPNEKPVVQTHKSSATKTYDKNDPTFQLDSKFKLEKLFPGVEVAKGIGASQPPPTLTTVLENGLSVASQELPGMMTSIALIVRAGSGYEVQTGAERDTGSTHLLELNAFRSTKNRAYQDLIQELEKIGGMVQCVSNRESIIYVMDVMRHEVARAFDILADTVLNPTFPEEELAEARSIVEFQQTELPSEVFSRDLLQRAAYQSSPLSNHHYCPTEEVAQVDAARLQRFREKHYYSGNCVLAVAGLDHDTAVALSKKAFAAFPVKKDAHGSVVVRKASDDYALSRYTGGMQTQTRELKEPFVKVAMGFEVGGWTDPLLVPLCVTQQILGGGSSFSAGGPGKGMFTRLYSQVLNRNFWAESVDSFLSIHERSGILGIDGACPEDRVANMIQVIMQQFTTLAVVPVPEDELQRAKNMLKSSMMMQLESRLVQCEDIARQLATYGKRDAQAEMCAKIDAVTAEDVMKVAQKMLAGPPAVGAVGHDLSHLPSYDKIAQYCSDYYMQNANKYNNTRFL